MPSKSKKSNVKIQDFTPTPEQKKQALQDEMEFHQITMAINPPKKNKSTVIEDQPELDSMQIIGRQVMDRSYRPNGGWKAETVYNFEDYEQLSKTEFNLCLSLKLDPLEAVALKKRGIVPDQLMLDQCVKNAAFHRDEFQLISQAQDYENNGLSFDRDVTDRVSKSNFDRLTALRCLPTRTAKEQIQLEYLEDQYKQSQKGEEEKESEPITCYRGYWEGHYHLNKHYSDVGGIHTYYDGSGIFCGLHIGIETKFPEVKGVNTPEDFKVIKALKFIDYKLCEGVLTMPMEKVRDFWLPILSGDGKHSLFATSLKMLDIPRAKTISIDGQTAWAGIPKLDWFSPELQALDPMDLLAILPEAEAKALMLHLGKMTTGYSIVAEGVKKSPVIECELSYSHRMLPILLGMPGIGKSTFLEMVALGIGKAGYSADVLGQCLNQFAWNGVINNNFMYVDDLTGQTMRAMLSSANLKSVVSNGKISTQKKGVDEVNAHSKCSMIMACNEIFLPKSDNLDAGVLNRMYVLQTRTEMQMNALSKKKGTNMLTREYWEHLSRELNVDTEALVLLLLRKSLDIFLDGIDVKKNDDGIWEQGKERGKIIELLKSHRADFQYKLPVEMVNNLTVSSRKCVILSQMLDKNLSLPESFDDSFNAFTLLHTSKLLCKLAQVKKNLVEKDIPLFIETYETDLEMINDKIRERHHILNLGVDVLTTIEQWVGCGIQKHILQQYNNLWSSKLNSNPDNDLVLGSKAALTFESIWETMIATITTKDGSKVEQERYKYATAFESARKDSEGYQIELDENLEEVYAKYRGLIPDEFLNWDKLSESRSLSSLNIKITTFEYDDE
jgi:hypothetical protein